MDKNYFMNHVCDHKYVEACGVVIRPLIEGALQVFEPRLPHEVLLAVGGWSGNRRTCSPTNSIEAYQNDARYDARTDKWVDISAAMKNVDPRIVLTDVSLFLSKN